MRLILWFCLVSLALAAPVSGEGPAAMITDLQGAVEIESPSQPRRKGDLMLTLAVGDRLLLSAQSTCTVAYLFDGHREIAKGPGRLQVGRQGLDGGAVTRLPASSALASLTPRSPAGAAHLATTSRGPAPGDAVLNVPGLAMVPPRLPLFEMPPAAGLRAPVRAELRDPNGKLLVGEDFMLSFSGPYAFSVKSLPGLKAGAMVQVVFLDAQGQVVGSRWLTVSALPQEKLLEELSHLAEGSEGRLDPTSWIARARLLENAGFHELALHAVLEALSRRPSSVLLAWAAELCDTVGRPVEARAYRALARPPGAP